MAMARRAELPLFILETVLFPHGTLPLHVVETRDRAIVAHCLENSVPIGIVLRRDIDFGGEPEPYLVGTTARITRAYRHDDGSSDIEVVGDRRFRIRDWSETDTPYPVGTVEPVVDRPSELVEIELAAQRARHLCAEILRKVMEGADLAERFDSHFSFSADPESFSFQLAAFVEADEITRQGLLQLDDTGERIEQLLPLLERHLDSPVMEREPLAIADVAAWITPN